MLARPLGILLFVLFALILGRGLWAAESNRSQFDQANRLYEEGKFGDAISLYGAILKAGRVSSGLLFNLGNAYFKNGEIGRAIYNYRRAQALAPRDPDVQANLRFARDRIAGAASVARETQ